MMSSVRIMLIISAIAITSVLAKNMLKEESDIHGKELNIDASRVRRSYYGNCHDVDTWFTYDGKGHTVYLDRQSPNCGLSAIRSFQLVRNSGHNHVRYDLSCCNLPKSYRCRTSTFNTPYNKDGKGLNIYLDRHHVSCPSNGFLKHFHLNRNDHGDLYRYTFSCCSPHYYQRSQMTCYETTTPANADGKGNMVYLDRHRPSCHIGYFINGFQLVRPTSTTIQYKYRCCAFYQ
ncbi:Hypothetical predicted protein [Mytilus galloprovincialis]|uniref:Uncharacterized protein n=2 Tax=Mytilus galloprovincialis TaxID=29158 RepID=A0A8B6GM70_MYTGA|nr:Hypothetical predicted protein [Mytilus galloprovincialis]